MKAEELINNNALTDITVCKEQKVVAVEIALTAVNMARIEIDKALSKNALSIINERKRQIEVEEFSCCKDDKYINGELSQAAACYAIPPVERVILTHPLTSVRYPKWWPKTWYVKWWKPAKNNSISGRKKELIKAGALILAELDRLDRLEKQQ